MYPEFQPVCLDVQPTLQDYVRRFPPYSDFSIWNLLAWDTLGKTAYSFLRGNLIVRSKDYYSDRSVYSVLGESTIDSTLQELCEITPCVEYVPGSVIEQIQDPDLFLIEADPDNDDYILSVDKLVNPRGNKMYSVRVEINRFPQIYPEQRVKALDLDDKNVCAEILNMTRAWCESREFNEESSKDEEELTSRFLYFARHFRNLSLGLYDDAQLIGITVNELFDANTAIMHIGKSDITYEGSSKYLMHMTARALQQRGVCFLNYGQDAGEPGLRIAKRAYRPVQMLKKYKVRFREIAVAQTPSMPEQLQLV